MVPENLDFLILFGKTGSGKSKILKQIAQLGHQTLRLEELARHKGSAFGGLGETDQPDQAEFEEMIKEKLGSFDQNKIIWVEFESGYLGKLQIPADLLSKLENSDMLVINVNRVLRISNIIDEYSHFDTEELLIATQKIKKKLSEKSYRQLRKSIKGKDFEKAVSILLSYYDKVYENGLKKGNYNLLGELDLQGTNSEKDAREILSFYQSL